MKPYLSHSQISMWQKCPRQYEYRYWKGLVLPPNVAMIQGSIYHKALELYFKSKMLGVSLSPDEFSDLFDTVWENYIKNGSSIDWTIDRGRAKDETNRVIEVYYRKLGASLNPALVEQRVKVNLDNSTYDFLGIIDLVLAENQLADHKVVSRLMRQEDADKDNQATAYAFLAGGSIDFEYHIAIKGINPAIQIVKTQRTENDITWWIDMAKGIAKQIQSGIAPPNPNGWWCNPKWCGYWNLCKGYR